MPENSTPAPPSPPEKTGAQPKPASPAEKAPEYAHVPMSEEFDRAKWTLPPIVPVLIAAAVVAVIIAVVSFTNRPTPVVTGTVTKLATADQDGNTMAAVQVKLDNVIEKQIWIKNIDSELETADGKKYTDHAAAASDANLYFKAFPQLMEATAEPLREELKIPAKTSFTGVSVFSYPVDTKTFSQRKALTLRIQLYDQPTV
ncbi:MAG TPA: hypothetical protein VFL42_00225, partial [Terriglobales bacterium]|nr:hypothetical protein [Terriglobales bacterium]